LTTAPDWDLADDRRLSCKHAVGVGGEIRRRVDRDAVWTRWTGNGPAVQVSEVLGWIESRNVAIEYRWAEGRTERAAEIAPDFVRLKVDVIYATPPTLAAKQATSAIPIAFAAAADPVGIGLVASLALPGGNVTGPSIQQSDSATKRLELLREVVLGLHRLAIMMGTDDPLQYPHASSV
jgi:ABC-type uncharacterized transport system substrate-binding protein